MKYLAYFLLVLIFAAGGKIKVTEATSQEWAGGQPESGYGTDFKISMVAKDTSSVFKIDGLWIGDIFVPVSVVRDPKNPSGKGYGKGDKIQIRGGLIYKPDDKGGIRLAIAEKRERPIAYTGAGLIEYTYKGKKKFQEIKEFKVLEKQNYQ
jgi:hypothetical protein